MNNELILYYLQTAGFGFVTGFAMGYAFKKISKFMIFLIGLILIILQILVYNGIININWELVETIIKPLYSENSTLIENIKNILLVNVPFAGAGGVGFFLGLRKG